MSEAVTLEQCSNGLAVITIDRPKALNAASVKMVKELREVIGKISASDSAKAVLMVGAGEKGFCSGGDVKGVYEALKADNNSDTGREQLYEEYLAIYELRQLKIPVVALIHGITMGFGLGLSSVATFRVATEKSRLAMPENNIGLFPDAGFAYLSASILPPGLGRLMAVTGVHLIGAGDAMAAKIATHYVPFEKFPSLVEEMKGREFSGPDSVEACIASFSEGAPEAKLLKDTPPALGLFQEAKTLAEAASDLKALSETDAWAKDLIDSMQKGAPFSQAVAWSLLDAAVEDSSAAEPGRLGNALERDFAAACRIIYRPDFMEGVRSVLVDKDNSAKWQVTSLDAVDMKDVADATAPLPEAQRRLGLGA